MDIYGRVDLGHSKRGAPFIIKYLPCAIPTWHLFVFAKIKAVSFEGNSELGPETIVKNKKICYYRKGKNKLNGELVFCR